MVVVWGIEIVGCGGGGMGNGVFHASLCVSVTCTFVCFGRMTALQRGKFTLKAYRIRTRKTREEDDQLWDELVASDFGIDQRGEVHVARPVKAARLFIPRNNGNCPYLFQDPRTGLWEPPTYESSQWWRMYCGELPPASEYPAFYERFADHFMVTLPMWKEMVSNARASGSFPKRDILSWGRGGHKVRSPLDIMMLGALRVLSKGWGFKEVSELTFISRQTHQDFFREFTQYGSRVLYPLHVHAPTTLTELENKNHECGMGGFPGCVHDSDGCTFDWPGCGAGDRNACTSYKGNVPSVNCLLTWDHRHIILHYTLGAGTLTDEVLQPLDGFLMGIYDGSIGDAYTFDLVARERDGSLTKQKYQGVYGLHDNGFLKWSTAAAVPMKYTLTMPQVRWSEMVESFRKSSENGNRDLKCRFQYLKRGFRQRNFEDVEHTMRTCLALHNWRKRNDGFAEPWPLQCTGKHMGNGLTDLSARLGTTATAVVDDGSTDVRASFIDTVLSNGKPTVPVINLDFELFRKRLVDHWDILWERHLIYWPTSRGPLRLQGRNALPIVEAV